MKTIDSLLLDNLLQWDFAKQKCQRGRLLVFLLLAFCLQINYPILCLYCLIDLPLFLDDLTWSWESWNLLAWYHHYSLISLCLVCSYSAFIGDFVWSSFERFCMGVLDGVTKRQVETPCFGVGNTRSGVRRRKVSRRLFDQASRDYIYSSWTIITDILT